MKWMVIKGVRYPSSVISAFAAYNMDNPFLKVRIRNKYHIVPFDDVNKMANQMVYLMDNYPDFVQIGRWWISKKAVIREIVPGMPEGNVRHAAECMCTDRMGSMMDIDIYILKEEDRPYECHYLKDLLEDRVARIAKMHEDESYTYNMDDNYWCATCGSHSHKKDSKTGYCWYCDTVNWVKEDGKDVGI